MSKITNEEKQLFDALHDARVKANEVFSQRAFRGVKPNVVDKYAEIAHFVYELLQNADDANATEVTIVLKADRLLFKHNGTKHFDITAEDDDKVGDINSITGIGNSSKENVKNKIGKFGVGFKAVFQYTNTPEIYDDTFKFKIEDLIVPTLIDHDHPERNPGETLFVIPFRNPNKSFNDIKSRLETLNNPILFLRNLKKIVWHINTGNQDDNTTEYSKALLEQHKYKDITLEKYLLKNAARRDTILLFSRDIEITMSNGKKTTLPIYIGFYYDEQKRSLITNNTQNIYCFFPTKETFKTCFISHAPFILTPDRHNIKRDENLNKDLLRCLSYLAADSVVLLRDYGKKNDRYLINENIVDIIPYYETWYLHPEERMFEEPMTKAFRGMLANEPVLLSRNKKYLKAENSYITTGAMSELLSQEQFYCLRNNSRIKDEDDEISPRIDFLKWELIMKLSKLDESNDVFEDIQEYTVEDFGNEISSEFMKAQKVDWVTKFYTFLRTDAPKYWKILPQTRATAHVYRSAPIIKTQRGEWVAPFINTTTPNVFLPIDTNSSSDSDYNFINNEYLKEDMARKFFNELEIKQPDEHDYIRNIVLKKYEESVKINDTPLQSDFNLFLSYYKKVKGTAEEDEFVKMLENSLRLKGTNNSLRLPYELYLKTDVLGGYFANKAVFFNASFYKDSIHEYKESFVKEFLLSIGIRTKPILKKSSIQYYNNNIPYNIKVMFPLDKRDYYNEVLVEDTELEGFADACQNERITKEISVFLWNEVLGDIFTQEINIDSPSGKCIVKASTQRRTTWDSPYYRELTILQDLKQYAWIYNKDGELCFAEDLFSEDLLPAYNSNVLLDILNIQKRTRDLTKIGATEEEQSSFALGAEVRRMFPGKSDEEIIALMSRAQALDQREKEEENKRRKKEEEPQSSKGNSQMPTASDTDEPLGIKEKLERKWEEKKNRHVNKPHSSTANANELSYDDTSMGTESPNNDAPFFVATQQGYNETEVDDTARAEKNLKAKDTSAQTQAENAKDMVEILSLLKEAPEYSFKWFKILMELMHAGQDKITERRVQIDFSRYELMCSDKVLHLTEPTQPVPAWICDAEKYSITALANGKTTKIDGMIVKTTDDSIDISIEVNNNMLTSLEQAKKIRIIATDNTNIINSLETRFLQLEKEDEFDMNANLPENLAFIYGPPGTGKTTELVKQVHDLLEKEPDAKILVLTPTNKAADVVAIKMSDDDVCEGGLARYGATESLYLIEEIGCVTNRDTTDMENWHNVVVATAARYAYDYVQPDDTAICDYPWDYIFIDEASMIDILTITYVLYKGANAKQIVISGDPKQIQPVVQNDMPTYNIYNMVGLRGFANAVNDYTRYPVKGLKTQHRSIPIIGEMVSRFAYDGLVQYDKNRAPMKPLKLDGIPIKNVNFIGFDVLELDDIKGLNIIGQSAFNLYSVIFTYNLVEYTINQIETNNPKQEYSIGVVCAYRAQSDAIKNMLENRPLDTPYCKVTCGTVHSFQGDECDIMFIVLNPPADCSSKAHVNNENIINVAMSRARDYLFFIMPNGQPKGFFMKNRIGKVIPKSECTILDCKQIEKVMFNGNDNFIYENTHVTCHMPVNVYCEDNALYEVRMSDEALDIKINQHLLSF
ncbi:MAG: AAA family ATPase [Bacteroidales bacterium]|nr:AAA family ATPase [Bacteroidales bacterium]